MITNKELVYFLLKFAIREQKIKPISLKSGGAAGIDLLAQEFFKEFYGIEPEVIKPDYVVYPDHMKWKAPLDRNGDVVRDVDYVIAIWSGETPEGKGGTWDATKKAMALRIPVIFINLKRGIIEVKR